MRMSYAIGMVLQPDAIDDGSGNYSLCTHEEKEIHKGKASSGKGRVFATLFVLILGFMGLSSVEAATWLREISDGMPNPLRLTAIIATADGGYAVAGDTTAYGSWYDAAVLVKLDGSGALQWQKVLGATNNEKPYALAQTSDGGYIIAGNSNSFHPSNYWAIWVVRLDSSGEIVWQKYYNFGYDDYAYDVIQTADGGFAVVGMSRFTYTYSDPYSAVFLKLNSDGTVQWKEKFVSGEGTRFSKVVQTSDGGYAVAGALKGTGPGANFDLWLVRLNPVGAITWQRQWGGTGDDYGSAVLAKPGGSFLLGGNARAAYGSPSHAWIIEVSGDGTEQWERSYGGNSSEDLRALIQVGDYFVGAGASYSFEDNGSSALWLFEVDDAGSVQWQKAFGHGTSLAMEVLHDVAPASDGGFLAAGDAYQFHSGCAGWVFLKVDASGSLEGSGTCLTETDTAFAAVDPGASTVVPTVPAATCNASVVDTWATDADFTPEVKVCDPLTISAPSGIPTITAEDVDDCEDTGVLISWPVDPDDWGDGGTGDRTYDVLRNGGLLASCLSYGTGSYLDDKGTNGTNYVYAVRYSNGGDLTAKTASVNAADNVSLPDAPTGVHAEDIDPALATGVYLTWSMPADWGDAGKDIADRRFLIYRGDLTPITGPLPATATNFTDTTGQVNPSFPYQYQVAAVNACGNETRCDYIQGEDDAAPPGETSGPDHPMTASKASSTSVSVSFTPYGCASADTIYWGTWSTVFPGLFWNSWECLPDASTSATFDPGDPAPGSFIYFVVVGNNSAAEGSYGQDSDGTERQPRYPSTDCSFPQDLGSGCPY